MGTKLARKFKCSVCGDKHYAIEHHKNVHQRQCAEREEAVKKSPLKWSKEYKLKHKGDRK